MKKVQSLDRLIHLCLYLAIIAASLSLRTTECWAATSYGSTYQSLVQAIYSASGQAYIDLTPGIWQTNLSESSLTWNVQEPTTVKTKFDYQAGGLIYASAEFSPPVQVTLRGHNSCISYKIHTIRYDENGRLRPPSMIGPNPDWEVIAPCTDQSLYSKVERHLEFATSPASLFSGLPFADSSGAHLANDTTQRPMVSRVQFFPSIDPTTGRPLPAMKVLFREGAVLQLGDNSSFTVSGDSGFQLSQFDYDVQADAGVGTLDNLNLKCYFGILAAGNTTLKLAPNDGQVSSVALRNVTFQKTQQNTNQMVFSGGTISSSLSQGSTIRLADSGPVASELLFGTPTSVHFQDFSLIVTSGQPDLINLGSGHIDASVKEGTICLSSQDYLKFGLSAISMDLDQCSWSNQTKAVVNGTVVNLDASVVGGQVRPNPDSLLRITTGHVSSNSLQIHSLTPRSPISGAFTDVTVKLDRNSTFIVPGKMAVNTSNASELNPGTVTQASFSAHSLTFPSDGLGPSGKATIVLPYQSSVLKVGNAGTVQSALGMVSGDINFAPGQSVTGTISADIREADGLLTLNSATHVEFIDGTLKARNLNIGGSLGVVGTFDNFSFTLRQGSKFLLPHSFTITTNNGAKFDAAAPAHQIEFRADRNYPVGTYKLTLPFIRLDNDNVPQFSILNGNAVFDLATSSEEIITGHDCTLTGSVNAVWLGSPVILPFAVDQGILSSEAGIPHFHGSLATTIPGHVIIPVPLTPYVANLDMQNSHLVNSTLFPMQLNVSTTDPLVISGTPFDILGTNVSLAPAAPLVMKWSMTIPSMPSDAGGGEHKNRFSLQDGTKNEPGNDYGDCQELIVTDVKDVVFLKQPTVHFYLAHEAYSATSDLTFGIHNNVPSGTINNTHFDRNIRLIRDGGGSVEVFSALIGTLIFPGVGTIVGASLGEAVLSFATTQASKIITAQLEQKSFSFGKP